MAQSKEKTNTEKAGMFTGFVVPIIAIVIFYLFDNPADFVFFLKQIFVSSSYTKIFGLCIIPNFIVFFIFRYQKKYKASEGVSIATLIYLIVFVILKYIN